MAVYFETPDPAALLKSFEARIDQTEAKGKVVTWERGLDKKQYTHASKEWKDKAHFKPKVEPSRLTFNIIRLKGIDVVTYAYYHGHLIETFLAHFDHEFVTGSATALPAAGDVLS